MYSLSEGLNLLKTRDRLDSLASCDLGVVFSKFHDIQHKGVQWQIDNSVVESFGARGRTCISSRVYPTLAVYENAHLYVFNNGSETITVENLAAWSMKKPLQMN
ncbi:hypothetical protein AgCh_007822 [Apium graveolens]